MQGLVPGGQVSALEAALQGPAQIGEWIAAFRRREGLTLDMLAERLGVSRQAVWYWESGRRVPRRATIARLNELGFAAALEAEGSADFSVIVRMAKDKLAENLGIDSEDIRIVIQG